MRQESWYEAEQKISHDEVLTDVTKVVEAVQSRL
jgi:hypothetical protein